ncbi:hypothetical protein D3C86_1584780 [compost metagenome]
MVSTPCIAFILELIKRQPIVVSSSTMERENALSDLPITNGALDIDSTPPATINSISPEAIALNALPTASKPEAHNRLYVTPGTDTGTPANRPAIRATFLLSSPAWLAQPSMISSINAGLSSGLLLSREEMGTAAKSSALTGASDPPKRPMGVRIASQIKTSRIKNSPVSLLPIQQILGQRWEGGCWRITRKLR